jgi:putative DNA primase/helicase
MSIPISHKKTRHVDAPQGADLLKDEQQRLDAQLLPFAEHLLRDWCGEVQIQGSEIVMRNPLRDDQTPGSFKFNTDTGAWSDFAVDDFKGYGLVSLYCAVTKTPLYKALPVLQTLAANSSFEESVPRQPKHEKPKVEAVNPDDVRLPPDMHPDLGFPSKTWEYRDKDGKLVFYVYRFDHDGKKETRPVAWSPEKNAWVWQYPTPPYPLYHLPELLARKEAIVVITEGEKAADAAARQFPDAVAITSVCGSEQALRSDWTPLKARQVIIAPDRDEPGRHYAMSVAAAAMAFGAGSVRIVDVWALDGWSKGDDLADHDVTAGFLDVAQLVTDFFTQTELEPHVVSAAATLSPGDFDRCKKSLAQQLGIDLRTFLGMVKEARSAGKAPDTPTVSEDPFGDAALEPWPEPVEGEALFKGLLTVIQRHVILSLAQAVAIAVWIVFSYGYDLMRICPQLLINSPSKRCGKSTLLELIMYLVRRALPAANISPAAVFRSIDIWKPTLLIDEADTFLNGKASDEITGILNSGHSRNLAYVVRTVEVDGEHVPKHFSTFCPKVIAMIKAPADTIIDRSIVITLTRKLSTQRVDALAIDASERFHDTRRRLVRWVEDNHEAIVFDAELVPPMSNDRARQNWSVLAAFAKALGDTTYAELIQAVTELGDTSEVEDNIEVDLLADLKDIATSKQGSAHIPSGILVKELLDLKHRPWGEINRGKALTENTLARLLKPFKLTPEKYRDGVTTKRGYARSALQEVFDRYLILATEATI